MLTLIRMVYLTWGYPNDVPFNLFATLSGWRWQEKRYGLLVIKQVCSNPYTANPASFFLSSLFGCVLLVWYIVLFGIYYSSVLSSSTSSSGFAVFLDMMIIILIHISSHLPPFLVCCYLVIFFWDLFWGLFDFLWFVVMYSLFFTEYTLFSTKDKLLGEVIFRCCS